MSEVWYNGRLMAAGDARISAADNGFLFGYGVFQVMRVYHGKVFRLRRHLEALEAGLAALRMPVAAAPFRDAVLAAVEANGVIEGMCRITVTPGTGSLLPDPGGCNGPTVLVTAGPYTASPPELYERGLRLVWSSIRRNAQSLLSGIKTTNYLESMLARQEARAAGCDEALLLNEKGLVVESGSGNVFICRNGRLVTPPLGSGFIPGIVREAVLELAPGLGIGTEEADITTGDAAAADEVFLTNSLLEVMPVVEIAGTKVGDGQPGAVTRQLLAAYRELVRRETA
jgi:branched-chain amino acid aminotransferase